MIVALDTSAIIAWSSSSDDDETAIRVKHLFSQVDAANGRVIHPIPAIAEFLVLATSEQQRWLSMLANKSSVVTATFDMKAAVECAAIDRLASDPHRKRSKTEATAYQAVKVDRQIVAIARVHKAKLIVTSDRGMRETARKAGLHGRSISDLALPDEARQRQLIAVEMPAPSLPPQ